MDNNGFPRTVGLRIRYHAGAMNRIFTLCCAVLLSVISLVALGASPAAPVDRGGRPGTVTQAIRPVGTGTFIDRWDAADFRLMAYNVEGTLIADSSRDAAYARIFNAVQPDLIVLEEIPSNAVEAQIAGWLDSNVGGGPWVILGGLSTGIRTVVASGDAGEAFRVIERFIGMAPREAEAARRTAQT